MTGDRLGDDRAARLLRAKAADLEAWVTPRLGGPGTTDLDWVVADVALIARLLADHLADGDRHFD